MADHIAIAPFEPCEAGRKDQQHPPEHQIEKDQRQYDRKSDRRIDREVEDTFPASDPPANY